VQGVRRDLCFRAGVEQVLFFPDQEPHPSGKDVETLGQGGVKVGAATRPPGRTWSFP
jgi:hypothetical protein